MGLTRTLYTLDTGTCDPGPPHQCLYYVYNSITLHAFHGLRTSPLQRCLYTTDKQPSLSPGILLYVRLIATVHLLFSSKKIKFSCGIR